MSHDNQQNRGAGAKIVLVTGATRGLGLAAAKKIARAGHHVIVSGRKQESLNRVAKTLADEGLKVETMVLDVARQDTVTAAVTAIENKHGRLDVLVNNAGVMLEKNWLGNTAPDVDAETLRDTFETNFFGQVFLTQALLPLLKKGKSANVVNVSSIMGSLAVHSDPKGPLAATKPFAYNASKAAFNAFTLHLAAALADSGITVNSAHQGWVKTDLGGEYAPMGIEEGAESIVNLALPTTEAMTGQFIHQGQNIPW